MKKLIDIPDDILKDLKKLAIDADLNLKKYIEKMLVDRVKESKKK